MGLLAPRLRTRETDAPANPTVMIIMGNAAAAAPAVLANRVRAAQLRAERASAEANSAAPAPPAKRTPPAKPKPATPPSLTAKHTQPGQSRETTRTSARGDAAGGLTDVGAPEADVTPADRVVAALRAQAGNAAMMSLLSDAEVLDLWNSVVGNAQVRGSVGAADRAALTRAVGLPWYGAGGAAGQQRTGGGTGGFGGLSDRLGKALALSEAASRRGDDTDDEDEGEDASEISAVDGDAPKMPDHMPVRAAEDLAPGEASPPSSTRADHPAEPEAIDLGGE